MDYNYNKILKIRVIFPLIALNPMLAKPNK